jgi:hypothetical protein
MYGIRWCANKNQSNANPVPGDNGHLGWARLVCSPPRISLENAFALALARSSTFSLLVCALRDPVEEFSSARSRVM